jgi:hypothetical protein
MLGNEIRDNWTKALQGDPAAVKIIANAVDALRFAMGATYANITEEILPRVLGADIDPADFEAIMLEAEARGY